MVAKGITYLLLRSEAPKPVDGRWNIPVIQPEWSPPILAFLAGQVGFELVDYDTRSRHFVMSDKMTLPV